MIVTEATDDTGADLKPAPGPVGDDGTTEFPPVRRQTGAQTYEELPGFYAPAKLKLPARQARKLASLKGEIRVLAGGGDKPQTITVPNVKSLGGKTASHPDLSRAGVTLQVAEPSQIDDRGLSVMISGRTPRDVSFSVIDADGKRISRGGSGDGSGGGARYWRIDLERPLRDSDSLTVSLPIGQKQVTVPFALKDVELP